jgi:hypothetical protein
MTSLSSPSPAAAKLSLITILRLNLICAADRQSSPSSQTRIESGPLVNGQLHYCWKEVYKPAPQLKTCQVRILR